VNLPRLRPTTRPRSRNGSKHGYSVSTLGYPHECEESPAGTRPSSSGSRPIAVPGRGGRQPRRQFRYHAFDSCKRRSVRLQDHRRERHGRESTTLGIAEIRAPELRTSQPTGVGRSPTLLGHESSKKDGGGAGERGHQVERMAT